MLTRLRLQGFKSFADAEAPFGPLTVLVGANASGKTNVLEAVRLLTELVVGHTSVSDALHDMGVVRGGARESARNGADAFAIASAWQVRPGRVLEYELTCAVRPELEVRAEHLRDPGDASTWLRTRAHSSPRVGADRTPAGATCVLEWLSGDAASPPVSEDVSSAMSGVWSALGVITRSPARRLAQDLSGVLRQMMFLNITPSFMRDYAPLEEAKLDENGTNLSAVLVHLCEDADARQGLVDWLSALCAPELADIEFSKTDEGDVMLRLIEKDGTKVSARSLSDGTLRFLGELVALRTAPPGSVILLEELGREVHPRRMHLLVEYLESVTEERGIQVIATTHSPDVLAALGPRARADAVVLGRTPDRAGTVMRRLGDLPHFEEVVERRGLGDLFTMGWLEQAL